MSVAENVLRKVIERCGIILNEAETHMGDDKAYLVAERGTGFGEIEYVCIDLEEDEYKLVKEIKG